MKAFKRRCIIYIKMSLWFRKKESSRFTSIPVSDLTWEVVESKPTFGYEKMKDCTHTRVFFDLDLKLSKAPMSRTEFDERVSALMGTLAKNQVKYEYVYTYDASYYKSAIEGKISTHIIFQNRYISRQTVPEKRYLEDYLARTAFEGMDKQLTDYFFANDMVDTAPYAIDVFRMPLAKHEGKMIHAPNRERSPLDYCVSYVPSNIRPESIETLYDERVQQIRQKMEKLNEPLKAKPGRPPKKEAEELPEDVILRLFNLLDARKRAYVYQDWLKLMLLTKTILGESVEGLDVFQDISGKSGYERYDEKEAAEAYEKANPNGQYTVGTLIHWAKEDDLEGVSSVLSATNHSGREEWDVVFVSSTSVDSMNDLVRVIGDRLRKDQQSKAIWFRDDNDPIMPHAWKEIDKRELSTYLLALVSSLKIATIRVDENDEYKFVSVSKDQDWLERNVWKYLDRYLIEELYLEEKFITTTKGKVCFQNGVWNFRTATFTLWEQAKDIRTVIVIPRIFRGKCDTTVPHKMFSQILGQGVSRAMKVIARALAGNTEDKRWLMATSMRDAAKSWVMTMVMRCFTGYVDSFESSHITVDSRATKGDASRELGWLRPHRFRRLIFSQELNKSEQDENRLLLDSKLLKKISGGDTKQGRDLFQTHRQNVSWNDNLTIMPLGNSNNKATNPDVFKNCIQINFPKTFFSPSELQKCKDKKEFNPYLHHLAQPDECEREFSENIDAFIWYILSHWEDTPQAMEALDDNGDVEVEEQSTSITNKFTNLFATHFMFDKQGFLLASDFNQFFLKHPSMEKLLKKKDLKSKLLEIPGVKEDNHLGDTRSKRGLRGVRFECSCCPDQLE